MARNRYAGTGSPESQKRDWKKFNKTYKSKPDQIKKRTMRNQARLAMIKEGRARVGDGKHVDHIKSVSSGGTNNRKNLRVTSAKFNNSRKG